MDDGKMSKPFHFFSFLFLFSYRGRGGRLRIGFPLFSSGLRLRRGRGLRLRRRPRRHPAGGGRSLGLAAVRLLGDGRHVGRRLLVTHDAGGAAVLPHVLGSPLDGLPRRAVGSAGRLVAARVPVGGRAVASRGVHSPRGSWQRRVSGGSAA